MPRVYDVSTYQKHKRPKGWASICPDRALELAQGLLETGVLVHGCVYNVDDEFAYRALEHAPGRWHGHPIPWSRLPNEARKALIAAGLLDASVWRKAVRQGWGREFS